MHLGMSGRYIKFKHYLYEIKIFFCTSTREGTPGLQDWRFDVLYFWPLVIGLFFLFRVFLLSIFSCILSYNSYLVL